MTVVQLAKYLHVSHPMVSMIETEEASPSEELEKRIDAWLKSGAGPNVKPKRGPYKKLRRTLPE